MLVTEIDFTGLWTWAPAPDILVQLYHLPQGTVSFGAQFTFDLDGHLLSAPYQVNGDPYGDLTWLQNMFPVQFSTEPGNIYVYLPGDGYHQFLAMETGQGFWQNGTCGSACAYLSVESATVFAHTPVPVAGSGVLGIILLGIFFGRKIWEKS